MTPAAPTTADHRNLPFETASWGRRVLALIIDWAVSTLIVLFLIGGRRFTEPGGIHQLFVPLAYVVESAVLTTLVGGSFGKLATRLRTVRIDGSPRPLDPLRSIARQIMIAVAVPPLIFRPDGRGLHDMSCATATVTLQTYRSYFLRISDGK